MQKTIDILTEEIKKLVYRYVYHYRKNYGGQLKTMEVNKNQIY